MSVGRKRGQVVQGLVGCEEDLGFYPKAVGALESCGQRRDRTDLGAHGHPVATAVGRTD